MKASLPWKSIIVSIIHLCICVCVCLCVCLYVYFYLSLCQNEMRESLPCPSVLLSITRMFWAARHPILGSQAPQRISLRSKQFSENTDQPRETGTSGNKNLIAASKIVQNRRKLGKIAFPVFDTCSCMARWPTHPPPPGNATQLK